MPKARFLVAALGVLPIACSSSGSSPSPASSCPAGLAAQMSSDTSGKTLAKIYQAHTPTPDEEKAVAALWIFMTVGADRGTLSDVFVASDLPQRVAKMSANYPGLVETCSSGSTGSTSAAITSCADFSCDANCYPDSPFLKDLKHEAINKIGEELSKYILGKCPIDRWYGIEAAMRQRAADMTVDVAVEGKDVTDTILGAFDIGDARKVEDLVGTAFTTTEGIGNAAVILGAGATVVELTELAGLAGTIWTVQGLASEFADDYSLVKSCWAFKADACGVNAPHLASGQCASNLANLATLVRVPNAPADQPCLYPCRGGNGGAGGATNAGGATGGGGTAATAGAAGASGGGSGVGGITGGGTTGMGGSTGTAGVLGAGGSPFDAGPPDAGDNSCCACNFDVYCTAFGQGGCWYCTNSTADSNGICQAPGLAAPGKCVCDPGLYQVCQ
jgi:hypothetical protein